MVGMGLHDKLVGICVSMRLSPGTFGSVPHLYSLPPPVSTRHRAQVRAWRRLGVYLRSKWGD